ncbi:MAG: FtsX-like permease family protein [Ekhidna sp.]|nr:FtsX-like permease family protein [Ekhidna sp.]
MLDDPQSEDALENALAQVNEVAAEFYPENEITLEYINLEGVVPRWNISQELGIGWDMPTMIFFLVIGLLVLLPAVFNYTNMSIARALKRSKEIGVRKVLGAEKYQIKAQFIVETVILSVLSLIGSLLILYPMKREFLSLLTAAEVLATDPSIIQILTFLIFAILVGIFAGIFPAQYFSRLNPIQTIKGEIRNGRSSISGFKKGLFVFQFFLSLIFVIGVFAIARQHTYALNNNHGFASENILTIPFGKIEKQVALNELSNHPDVKTITTSSSLPGVQLSKKELLTSNDLDTIEAKSVFIGNDFIEQMQMELAWGESTSIYESNQSEERVLVNRQFISALKVFNMQKDTLRFTLADGTKCRIVGILNDLNFEPLSEIIDPLVMRYSVEESEFALITVSSDNIKGTIKQLEKIWLNVNQEASFDPTFLDAEIEDAYYFLEVQMKFFTVLSTLAISISCLGLLGMVSYNTENRTKEIAVRKIMGATDGSLYYLLTKDFVRLIMIGALIAVPVSYVFYDKLFLYYLIRYGTGLGLIEVILSIFFLFFVGAVSIYWQTSKVTKANPATKLRYE